MKLIKIRANLRGRVKFPIGGKKQSNRCLLEARDPLWAVDSVQLRSRRLQSGWKKVGVDIHSNEVAVGLFVLARNRSRKPIEIPDAPMVQAILGLLGCEGVAPLVALITGCYL